MVAALVSTAALGGCGSSSQTLSAHDHSAVKQFGVLVRQYQSLEKAIGAARLRGAESIAESDTSSKTDLGSTSSARPQTRFGRWLPRSRT